MMADGVILIAVDNKGNVQLLRDMLKRQHTVKVLETEADLQDPFDLVIFDGVSLSRLRKLILARQAAEPNVFLPVLLVTSRQDIRLMTRQLWKSIDELIFTPVEKIELLARVEVLLRARSSSVELAHLYKNAREQATFDERQRLARELHDTVSQMIFSASVLAQTLPQIQKKDPQRAQQQLEEVVQLNRSALSEMRSLLFELRPSNLMRMSLEDLYNQLAIAVRGHRPINIGITVEVSEPLPEDVHLGLYRIVQEAFNNIVKHSEATEASVSLSVKDGQLVLEIRDNGRGFDTDKAASGFGLEGMKERVSLMNATLQVSSQPGKGTFITVTQPIPTALTIKSSNN
jgi:signal transduction histidine kinase